LDYDDVVVLRDIPYLIRHNAKESGFGLDDEPKFWVKHAINLIDGSRKILKLVFHEQFTSTIGNIEFQCVRSAYKEARILKLVASSRHFMHGFSVEDEKSNVVRVLDFIEGNTLSDYVAHIDADHETYLHELLPGILDHFMHCIEAIRFLHDHGEKHGDIRRDHVLIDADTGDYRWIDFDLNYRHYENICSYDLFRLGNVLLFLVGQGHWLLRDLKRSDHPALSTLSEKDMSIVFGSRVVNLRKLFPYIPDSLNRILMHFAKGSNWFYENTAQLLEDLKEFRNAD
jgi:serine/threonine protein kinase